MRFIREIWREALLKATEPYWRERIAKEVLGYFAHEDRPMDCIKQIANDSDNCTFVEEVADFIKISASGRNKR